MPTTFEDFFILGVIYLLAYGMGTILSMLWKWLRILIVFAVVSSFIADLNFAAINMPNFLVLIVPMGLFVYPSLVKIFAPSSGFLNPLSWLFERINESRYLKRRQAEQEKERENMERMERIIRMQTEEAERQRQYEREKAEREARERAEYQRQQRSKNESAGQQQNQGNSDNSQDQQQRAKSNSRTNEDPYAILGVSRDMSKAEIRKAYLKLMNQYAPDRVSHLSSEFQEMAHEKCIAFNLAWEKIQKEKRV